MTWAANGRKIITLVSKPHPREQVVGTSGCHRTNRAFGRTKKTSFRGRLLARRLRMVSFAHGRFSSSVMLASVAGVESHIG